jgi:hypothetical protein
MTEENEASAPLAEEKQALAPMTEEKDMAAPRVETEQAQDPRVEAEPTEEPPTGAEQVPEHPAEAEPPAAPPRAEQPTFLTETRFADFELPDVLLKGLADAGFINCTPIQAQTLPISLEGTGCGRSGPDRHRQDRRFSGDGVRPVAGRPQGPPGCPWP